MEQDTISNSNQPPTQPPTSPPLQPSDQKPVGQATSQSSEKPILPSTNEKSKKTLIIALVILLIIIGVGISAALSVRNQTPSPTSQPQTEETAPDVETYYKTKGSEITSGWETHTASTYKVKYPSDVQVNEQEGGRLLLTKSGPTQKTETEFYDGLSLSFRQFDLSGTNLETYVQGKTDESEEAGIFEIISGPSPVNIGNYSGRTYTSQGVITFRYIYLQSTDSTMLVEIIDSTSDLGNLGYEETVNQILSTFQFTE